jgi:hypothetical protein
MRGWEHCPNLHAKAHYTIALDFDFSLQLDFLLALFKTPLSPISSLPGFVHQLHPLFTQHVGAGLGQGTRYSHPTAPPPSTSAR